MRRKLCDTILIGTAKEVFALFRIAHIHIREKIYDLTQYALIKIRACVVLRKNIFKRLIICFNRTHSSINHGTYLWSMRLVRNLFPTSIFRDKEYMILLIGIGIVLKSFPLRHKFIIPFLKHAGNIA